MTSHVLSCHLLNRVKLLINNIDESKTGKSNHIIKTEIVTSSLLHTNFFPCSNEYLASPHEPGIFFVLSQRFHLTFGKEEEGIRLAFEY
jgi:hypothetical protein